MSLENRQFRLAARPHGLPKRTDWNFVKSKVEEPSDGQILVKNEYLSLDPAMRGWMNEGKSYIPPVKLGDVMRAGAAGRVIASKHPQFAVGDEVVGAFGVQDYAISDGLGVRKVDSKVLPLPVYLNVLGIAGLTAYFGLLDIGKPKAGETVVVSGAAGAVGSCAGQIAKIYGCRVIGIAGGEAKCRYIREEFGFDEAIDYKSEDVSRRLKQLCPDGVNGYFDNVGGDILDAVLANLAFKARIVLCGAISQYNSTVGMRGPSNYLALLIQRAKMEGMIVFDYADRYEEAIQVMKRWILEGKLRSKEQIVDGLEQFPEALLKLFYGENIGKLLLRVNTP